VSATSSGRWRASTKQKKTSAKTSPVLEGDVLDVVRTLLDEGRNAAALDVVRQLAKSNGTLAGEIATLAGEIAKLSAEKAELERRLARIDAWSSPAPCASHATPSGRRASNGRRGVRTEPTESVRGMSTSLRGEAMKIRPGCAPGKAPRMPAGIRRTGPVGDALLCDRGAGAAERRFHLPVDDN
jgi:hypothetical protein